MNIKKIIREEVDDLQWIRDIPARKAFMITNNGMAMYIHDAVLKSLQTYALPNNNRKKEILLGDFVWKSAGMNYKFTAYVRPLKSNNEETEWWKVIGNSGDSGFGFFWLTKRNTIGKRGRQQIFKQIINRFDLNSML